MSELELKFAEMDFPHFFVEFAEVGEDMLYHFWPPGSDVEFCRGFPVLLERGFMATLPPTSVVRASYTDLREARVQHIEGVGMLVPRRDSQNENAQPRETIHVRVVNGMTNPLASMFLKDRIFRNIEAAIDRGL